MYLQIAVEPKGSAVIKILSTFHARHNSDAAICQHHHSCLMPVKADLVNYYLSHIDLTGTWVSKGFGTQTIMTKMRSARFDIYAHAYRFPPLVRSNVGLTASQPTDRLVYTLVISNLTD